MIRAEHITKSFEGRTVLKDISATFETGKTNLIIGQSGSGTAVKFFMTTSVTRRSRSRSGRRSANRSA